MWSGWRTGWVLLFALGLAACSNGRGSLEDGGGGGGQQQAPPKVTIGGTVSGLSGSGLVLQNNGGDDLAVSANGAFSFKTSIDAGSPYNVTVLAQPANPSQGCTIANATGTATNNVTNVNVACSTGSFSVGGTVAGLVGSGLVWRNNGGDDLPIASNGSFTFATTLASGSGFAVTVAAPPTRPSQTCTVADGAGTIAGGDVRTVKVSCATNAFTIRGTVSGLLGKGLVLTNNDVDNVNVETDGGFAFATKIASGSDYNVEVAVQPSGPLQACSVQNPTGQVADHDVDNIVITCALSTFTIGGTITNLQNPGLRLTNNGTDELRPTMSGPFTFPTALLAGARYDVVVEHRPQRQVCEVQNGSGIVPEANVTDIVIRCFITPFIVEGTVSGLESPGLELQTNGEKLAIAANGKFTMPSSLPDGTPYDVTVARQPANQECSVTNGRGAIEQAGVSNVTVTCRRTTE
jgi:hypothetical protein